jgi:hypothetical protein
MFEDCNLSANAFHVNGDEKNTRSVQCIIFLITGGRIPSITEMSMNQNGLRSMQEIYPVNLRMSSSQWEKLGLLTSGKVLDHVSMYGTDLSNEENAESMMRMFVGLPAEVITPGVPKIHKEFSKFFCAEYFDNESDNKGGPLAILRGIQQCFIDIQNRCVWATDDLSRLVIETAGQLPATLNDLRAQELALNMQTRLL